ncbi:hypothetical protein YC2023_084277 [Brassica napus]
MMLIDWKCSLSYQNLSTPSRGELSVLQLRPTHSLGYHDHSFSRSVFIWPPSYNSI